MIGAVTRRRLGAAAGGALALAALAACSGAGGDPSPTPSITLPPPSPAPAVTVDEDGRALPGFVTVSEELPPAQAAQPELLPQTGPGWSLQTYRPQVEDVSTLAGLLPGSPASVQVVYLVSPQGQRFQLLELDPASPLVIESWTAGETVAYVRQCEPLDCDPDAPTQALDLETGELAPVDGVAEDMHVGATLAGSVRWWQNGLNAAALETNGSFRPYDQAWIAASSAPDGAHLAVMRRDAPSAYVSSGMAIVNAEAGTLTDLSTLWVGPLECEPFRWRTDSALDASCYQPALDEWGVWAVAPDAQSMLENAAATATPPEEGPWVEPDFFVSESVWAGPYTADAAARLAPGAPAVGLARNAGFEALTVPDAGVGSATILASVGGSLYISATQATNLSLESAWRYEPATGEWTELGPLPTRGPTRGLFANEGAPASGMTSWVVAP